MTDMRVEAPGVGKKIFTWTMRGLSVVLILFFVVSALSPLLLPVLQARMNKMYEAGYYDIPFSVEMSLGDDQENVGFEDATITNTDTGAVYSLLPYAHANGSVDWSLENQTLDYFAGGVSYHFDLHHLENKPEITFNLGKKMYVVTDENGTVGVRRKNGFLPFALTQTVCPLETEDTFYAPIRVKGLEGYAIVTSQPQTDAEDLISVSVRQGLGWDRAKLILPDGTETDRFSGKMRRLFILGQASGETFSREGQFELCQTEDDGTATLYLAVYEDGQISLEYEKTLPDGIPEGWKF